VTVVAAPKGTGETAWPFRYRDLHPPELDALAKRFLTAAPFPHVVIDDFVTTERSEVLTAFPDHHWEGWSHFKDAYQHRKMSCGDIDRIPGLLAHLIQDLSSPAFLEFLEGVTCISRLLPDPYLAGGGLHCSGPGGVLAPHTDFHYYQRLHLFRRVNVIVYLTDEAWKAEFGGCLELYKKGDAQPTVTVDPVWGRCVIFKTDDRSVHGFSKPIVGDRWRRSIALYYYTSQESASFSGDADTHWRTHGSLNLVGRARLQAYKTLMFGSRCFSRLAHRFNPYLGSSLRSKAPGLEKR
jgi:hypothetical protein